jgi:predicted nuclease of predicted toxin-antitoxin system
VKLLFDENLSFRLVAGLNDLFPDSAHVRDVGLSQRSDDEVWRFAAINGFGIVSKDEDFHQRSFLRGHPPKVIWIRRGNCATRDIDAILRENAKAILAFDALEDAAFLAIS